MKRDLVILFLATAALQAQTATGKLTVATPRIDLATHAAGTITPADSEFDIGVWHYPGWYEGSRNWQALADLTPWRMPLLYDSANPTARASGIQYYSDGDPRVMDWHVKWMAEHSINWIIFDWYPRFTPGHKLDPSAPLNRALDVGFLGMTAPGAAPSTGNRFEKTMRFAVMWTNHAPFDELATDLGDYLATHYFRQTNYYRIDGKPLLPLWSMSTLVKKAGSVEAARRYIAELRASVRQAGAGEIYIVAVCQPYPGPVFNLDKQARELTLDGAMSYWTFGTSPEQQHKSAMQLGGKTIQVLSEDYATESMPGMERGWEEWRKAMGRDYLVSANPMQDWRGLSRDRVFALENPSPAAFEELLRHARAHIEKNSLRRIITVEAWNEWAEGSYIEPSIEYGFGWLDAIRRVFAKPPYNNGSADHH